MRWRLFVSAVLVGGAAVAAVAAAQPQGVSKASDIVPAMAAPQKPPDVLPASAANAFGKTGIDLGSSRLLGQSGTMRYYAVSRGADLICLIPVSADAAKKPSMGCTRVSGFEAYGLRVGLNGNSDEGWLVVPNTGQAAMGKDPSEKWAEVAPDFLVRQDPARSGPSR